MTVGVNVIAKVNKGAGEAKLKRDVIEELQNQTLDVVSEISTVSILYTV